MASSYPGGYDTIGVPPANLSDVPHHDTLHLQLKDAVEAMQHTMGINPSGADANIAATLTALAGRYVAISPWVTTFNPVVQQHATAPLGHTVSKSQWHYDDDMVEWEARIDITGTGVQGLPVLCTLPIAALSAANWSMGVAEIFDASTAIRHVCVAETLSAGTMQFGADQGTAGNLWGASPSIALDAGDQIRFRVRYRWR